MVWLVSALFLTILGRSCLAYVDSRIVGGFLSTQNQFPYQISLHFNGRHFCGGSIINDQFILTAAHCVTFEDGQKIQAAALTVLAGTNRLNSKNGTWRNVDEIIVHPNYKRILDDISLVKLSTPLKFSEAIRPIELFADEVTPNSSVIISGWGSIYTKGPMSNILKYNMVRSISAENCAALLGRDYEGLMCLAHAENNGACTGDSGGPAVYNDKLIGVANYIIRYCGSSKPDVYAKVSQYIEWIRKNIK